MDAAIGRLHLSITVAEPVPEEAPAPEQDNRRIERAFRRQQAERAAEIDRSRWSAEFDSRGPLL